MAHLPTPIRGDDAAPTASRERDRVRLAVRVPRSLKRDLALIAANTDEHLQTVVLRALAREVTLSGVSRFVHDADD